MRRSTSWVTGRSSVRTSRASPSTDPPASVNATICFSTNLEPSQLADDAFLRRIPYKIECRDPSGTEFHKLFRSMAKSFRCDYKPDAVDYLIDKHYKPLRRPLRRCQPRDLMSQV